MISRFKIGDRVRIGPRHPSAAGATGTVTRVWPDGSYLDVELDVARRTGGRMAVVRPEQAVRADETG